MGHLTADDLCLRLKMLKLFEVCQIMQTHIMLTCYQHHMPYVIHLQLQRHSLQFSHISFALQTSSIIAEHLVIPIGENPLSLEAAHGEIGFLFEQLITQPIKVQVEESSGAEEKGGFSIRTDDERGDFFARKELEVKSIGVFLSRGRDEFTSRSSMRKSPLLVDHQQQEYT